MSSTIDTFLSDTYGIEENCFAHYGVKGMKWGVRKDQELGDISFRKELKGGGELIATKNRPSAIARGLSKISKTVRENTANSHHFTLRDKDGNPVGQASFVQDSPSSLNLEWISVKASQRGQGYASAALQGVVAYAKDRGLTKLTLEVPGASDDALHIYEKLGFKKLEQITDEDDFWGGLTSMELNLPAAVKHDGLSDLDFETLTSYVADALDDAFENGDLLHYGVKGMKWGVRKDPERSDNPRQNGSSDADTARRSLAKALSPREKEVLKKLGHSESDSKHMEDKFGKNSLSREPKPRLSPKAKKILKGVGIGALVTVGVAATAYAAFVGKTYFDNKKILDARDAGRISRRIADAARAKEVAEYAPNFRQFLMDHNASQMNRAFSPLSDDDVKGLNAKDVVMKAGDLLKRVSTQKETEIRPGGFFGAFNDADVNRYKAMIPIYWKKWGYNAEEGFVVNLKAKTEIRAASQRKAFDLFVKALDDELTYENPWSGKGDMITTKLRQILGGDDETPAYELAKFLFTPFSQGWVQSNSIENKHFFQKVFEAGYNALVDANDAGALSETPLRILDGKLFEIAGHDVLDKSAIKAAQDAILSLAHGDLVVTESEAVKMEGITSHKDRMFAHYGIELP